MSNIDKDVSHLNTHTGPEVKTNSNAIISLILSILSFFIPVIGFILAIVSIILSFKAKKTIKETNEEGKGLATAGLIVGIISILIQIIAVIVLFMFFSFLIADLSNTY